MAEFNRRKFPRKNVEDTIQVLLMPEDFESPEDSCASIPARLLNQSDNGVYIEIDCDLQIGSKIRIKMAFEEESCFDETNYIRDGRIIWCKKIDDATSHFGVGIKILQKLIRAHILTSRF
jgi:hypothetical protein